MDSTDIIYNAEFALESLTAQLYTIIIHVNMYVCLIFVLDFVCLTILMWMSKSAACLWTNKSNTKATQLVIPLRKKYTAIFRLLFLRLQGTNNDKKANMN